MVATAASLPPNSTTYKVATPTRHIDSLRPNPVNPRGEISEEDPTILEMAASIVRFGIIEPLVIDPHGMLVAGHRRRVAARVAARISGRPDLMIVPVTVREVEPGTALELMLQENMQRQSLTVLEEARAMYAIMEQKKLTVADLARELAVPPKDVIPRLAILKCEPDVQKLFAEEELPLSAAPWLARIMNAEQQIHYAGLLARRQITLTKLKEVCNAQLTPAPTAKQSERETTDDIPAPPKAARTRTPPPAGATSIASVIGHGTALLPRRAEAMEALARAMNDRSRKRTITLFNFKAVLDSICCACGMEGKAEVCRSCPFPRIILGVAGRAD